MSNENSFKHWCILELFGHQMSAGMVSEQNLGGASFVRVDVPAAGNKPAYTKLYHHNAIYAITPTDEETARRMVESLQQEPVAEWRFADRLPVLPASPDWEDE
jgi:hypothetical protein